MPLQTNMVERQQYPFFSSTLLDKIYTSMEEGYEAKLKDPTFYRKTFYRKETAANGNRKPQPQFVSSCSTSSEAKAAGFSSSAGESKKTTPSCFAPFSLKPVKTNVAEKHSKKKQSNGVEEGGSGLLRSKAMKIYDHLKKVKNPISPGGRLSSFFTSWNHKNKNMNVKSSLGEKTTLPTCTSASSFSRSCLSKNSPSTRDKMKNKDKRTVRFYPMIVTFDGDSKPCSRKWLYGDEGICDEKSRSVPILVPKDWKIGRSCEDRKKVPEVKKGGYCCNEKGEDSDSDASCTSSDLFELDHLSVTGFKGCNSELPVFESTRIVSNSDRDNVNQIGVIYCQ